MFKPSLTVHKDAKGVVKVLVCSEDAGKCLDAYRTCADPGEVQLIVRGHFSKGKRVESKKQIAAKAKERTDAAKARAKAELTEAEKAAKTAAETAEKAKAKVEALKPKKAK